MKGFNSVNEGDLFMSNIRGNVFKVIQIFHDGSCAILALKSGIRLNSSVQILNRKEMYTKVKLTIDEILEYEVGCNRIIPYISHPFLQDLMGRYMAWKVRRKYNRYVHKLAIRNILKNNI